MRDQSIAVKGRLLCGPKAASRVRVKLWEEDGGTSFDLRTFGLCSRKTNVGTFRNCDVHGAVLLGFMNSAWHFLSEYST